MGRVLSRLHVIAETGYFAWGLLFAGWSPVFVVFGYWLGEIVHYFFTLGVFIVMGARRGRITRHLPFFSFAFAMILFVHTVFFIVLCGFFAKNDRAAEGLFDFFIRLVLSGRFSFPGELARGALTLLAVVVVTRAIGFYTGFVRAGFHDRLGEEEIFNRSFRPVIIPHFIIIFGIAAIMLFDAHHRVALIIVAVKFLFDWLAKDGDGAPPAGEAKDAEKS